LTSPKLSFEKLPFCLQQQVTLVSRTFNRQNSLATLLQIILLFIPQSRRDIRLSPQSLNKTNPQFFTIISF
jgi:hypothetical protein